MNRAIAAWGASLPDWVRVLAKQCDRQGSQAKVAKELGYDNSSIVNQVLGRTNTSLRLDRVEAKVRGVYMRAVVECPVLGEISTRVCLDYQLKGREFKPTNPLRRDLFIACKTCPNREDACSKDPE